MRRLISFLTIVFVLMFTAYQAYACSCLPASDARARTSFDQADVVIRAKINEVSGGWGSIGPLAKMDVVETYKGQYIQKKLTVNYNSVENACGNELNVGETYVLGLFDLRDLGDKSQRQYGYGFRTMIQCDQIQIRHYIEHLYKQEKENEE